MVQIHDQLIKYNVRPLLSKVSHLSHTRAVEAALWASWEMSSRNEDCIPFEIAQDLHGLRLLELPPSLLELVRSGDSAL